MTMQKKWAGVIYVLTNLVNGKKYVGKTEKLRHEDRWGQHIKLAAGESQNYIHRAIHKYGTENFFAEVVQHCRTSATLSKAEIKWIKRLCTFGAGGYNMTTGGEGVVGYKLTKLGKKKRSLALLLHWSESSRHDT